MMAEFGGRFSFQTTVEDRTFGEVRSGAALAGSCSRLSAAVKAKSL